MNNNFEILKEKAINDLENLQTEICKTISNEELFAMGSKTVESINMHLHNAEMLRDHLNNISLLLDVFNNNDETTINEIANLLDIAILYIRIVETEENNNDIDNLKLFYKTYFC